MVHRCLRRFGIANDTTIQVLLGETRNDLFAKHGLPEFAEGLHQTS